MSQHTGSVSAVADAYMKASNAHDVTKLGDQISENVVYWEPVLPSPITGRKAVEEHLRESWKSFPDANLKLVNRIVSGDWVAEEVVWSATHKGPIKAAGQTIPPTGKQANGRAIAVLKVEHGKITRLNWYYDNLPMLSGRVIRPANSALHPAAGRGAFPLKARRVPRPRRVSASVRPHVGRGPWSLTILRRFLSSMEVSK